MSLPPKPLPEITDQTRPFWTAANDGRLVLQRCTRCGTHNFHPKPWCIECGCRDIPWTPVSGLGTVYARTVSTTVAMNYPGWASELPVVMCLIDLDEGARLYAQVTDCDPAAVSIGMRVEVHFAALDAEQRIPKFRPARAGA